MNLQEFQNPGMDYRGVTLWMLNDKLEEEEIARQLEGFYESGWGALITRTFNGLRTEYLGDEWHRIVHRIIDIAGQRGIKVWLQAGYMPAGVPKLDEMEQHLTLVRKTTGEEIADGEGLLLEEDGYRYCSRNMPHTLDLLNPAACANYMRQAYSEPMEEKYGAEMGKTVETVWVDEPHFNPPLLPWARNMPEEFSKSWGYDLIPELPKLFSETGDYRKIRHHYWRIILDMLLSAYFAEVSRWCSDHGIAFSGHLMGEDTLQAQISWTAACMPCYEYMGLPGIDHLTRSLSWPAERSFIMTPKQCSSAANQLGQERKLAEMYGVSSQGLSFADRKRIAEWLMMLGINYRCYHGSFYSMRGRRKRIYACHLSYQQPWWEENAYISKNFSRFSYVMRQGDFAADVLVIHPVESAFCEYTTVDVTNPYERVDEPQAVRHYTEQFISLSEQLISTRRGFEYGDETMMMKHGSVDGAAVLIGKSRYSIVVIPDTITIRETTLSLLKAFADSGGLICATGETPSRIDGVEDPRATEFFAGVPRVNPSAESLIEFFDTGGAPYTTVTTPDGKQAPHIWLHERDLADSRIIVVSNPTEDAVTELSITTSQAGRFERWSTADGTRTVPPQHTADTQSTVATTLYPAGSEVFCFYPGDPADDAPGPESVVRTTRSDVEYTVQRLTDNALTLDFCRYRKDGGSWSDVMPVIAVQEQLAHEGYQGPVSLQFTFTADIAPDQVKLVIEDADECSITVNGQNAAYDGLPYYMDRSFLPVDISALVVAGENSVEITREFTPPSQPRFRLGGLFHTASGVELESVYIIGDFGVAGNLSSRKKQPKAVRFGPEFTIQEEGGTSRGDLLDDGYPFFAGRMKLSCQLDIEAPNTGERIYLCIGDLQAAVTKVSVNGAAATTIGWMPYEVDVTETALAGTNTVEIELITSLRNLLGPHHRPTGEPDQVWADGWTGHSEARRRDTKIVSGREWWTDRNSGEVFWTDDYFFVPYGIDPSLKVEYRGRMQK